MGALSSGPRAVRLGILVVAWLLASSPVAALSQGIDQRPPRHPHDRLELHRGGPSLEPETASTSLDRLRAVRAEGLDLASTLHHRGVAVTASGRLRAGDALLRRALAIRSHQGSDSMAVASSMTQLAVVAWGQDDLDAAEDRVRGALLLHRRLVPGGLHEAGDHNRLATLALHRGELDNAAIHHASALAIYERLAPGSASHAESLNGLGSVAQRSGDHEAAARFFRQALEILGEVAPASWECARSHFNLGVTASAAGDLDSARDHLSSALEILEQMPNRQRTVVDCLRMLGNVLRSLGDLAAAEGYYRRSLDLAQRVAPGSLVAAGILDSLGITMRMRGDLATADSLHRQAMTMLERIAPNGADHAESLNSLAIIARLRGDLETAERVQRRALEIRRRIDPGGPSLASSLNNLGLVCHDRGDLTAAEDHLQQALELYQRLAPGSLKVAAIVGNLGEVAESRGDLEAAAALHQRALDIAGRIAPDGLEVAESLLKLSEIRAGHGELADAETLIRRALAIHRRLAPDSFWVADSLHALGLVLWLEGERPGALSAFRSGIQALEAQQRRVGGSDQARAAFRASSMDLYRDAIELAVETGRLAEAVHLLERSRARVLLEILAERDLVFARDVPEALEQQRRQTAAAYDQTQARLARTRDPDQIRECLSLLAELRQHQAELRQEVRGASRRLAELRDPQPLDLAGVRSALPQGTALVAYSVGREQTQVVVLDPADELAVSTLRVPARELRAEVLRLRRLIALSSTHSARQGDLVDQASELYQQLIAPAASALASCQRLLIVADGPLHLLPFAALVDRAGTGDHGPSASPRYLLEAKPLHHALSVTVYAELQQPRANAPRSHPGPILVAFGDPDYSAAGELMPRAHLDPLPATRDELRSIAAAYGHAALTYTGAAATEERAKSVGHGPSILHFAVHGLIDERFPLDSALVFSVPAPGGDPRDNGMLQAWEVFEQLRLDADLVTLSACETALGKEVAGEGIIGLTRAFQYAGARSVLASLWRVSDASTAELMGRFYRHLRAGVATDQSLRLAQLELLQGPLEAGPEGGRATLDAGHPFHWAGLVLIGAPGRATSESGRSGRPRPAGS